MFNYLYRARRIRKGLGGSMRQAGVVAAAGIYALDNCVERMAEDHKNAQKIGYGITIACLKMTLSNINNL